MHEHFAAAAALSHHSLFKGSCLPVISKCVSKLKVSLYEDLGMEGRSLAHEAQEEVH